ncbi:MAG: DNA repair protein RecN [Polyangiaceae bacterium]
MLTYLRIRGLALLSDATLELGPGLTVLSGETGAGKSIIAEALLLIRGMRARADLVRSGESALRVDAQFDLSGATLHGVSAVVAERELPLEGLGELVVQRVVQRSGRSRSLVQGELVQGGSLLAVGDHLISVCSQHEHHSLVNVVKHLELIDDFAGVGELVAEYKEAYDAYRAIDGELTEAREVAERAAERAELLRHHAQEMTALAPRSGEADELRARLALLSRASEYTEFAQELREQLYEADGSLISSLSRFAAKAERGKADSAHLVALGSELRAAIAACEEAVRHAARLENGLDADPSSLRATEQRLESLENVAAKHRVDVERLPSLSEELQAQIEDMDGSEQRLTDLEQRRRQLESRCRSLAAVLSERRRLACARIARELRTELDELCMTGARVEAQIETSSEPLGPRGLDQVELHFSANPGEPLAPLSKVASGGELSRVLLAIQGVLAKGDSVSTYVFDEVDAGVGGAVAEAIGRRLRRIAAERQVICITHLPQIAAFADHHLRVEKGVEDGRTVTRVSPLGERESVEEIARMLAGARVTKSALEHARELKRAARGAALRVVNGNAKAPALRTSRKTGAARQVCG